MYFPTHKPAIHKTMHNQSNPFAAEIAAYVDKKILNILRNPKKSSPKIVEGCQREAEHRNITSQIVQVASANAFDLEAKKFSDEKLNRIARDHDDYNIKLVQAVMSEMKNRGLEIKHHEIGLEVAPVSLSDLITIQQKIAKDRPINDIVDELQLAGHTEEEAVALVDKAARSKSLKARNDTKEEKSSTWSTVSTIFFIIWIVIKIIQFSR